ncbi:MAG: PD40 domain-containing protein, partial [Rubrobacteridae bacterium]|nr:PD40 domain-containing protein [Rubrobacteridae bacterium]
MRLHCIKAKCVSRNKIIFILTVVFALLSSPSYIAYGCMDVTELTRLSIAPDGTEGDNHSISVSISEDGRYVAFASMAGNLVAGDGNGVYDIFVRDTQDDTTTRVSIATGGTEGNGNSNYPSISADGRYVVFSSVADNLVAGDTNGVEDVFMHDTQSGTTTRVSVATGGDQADNESNYPSISANGRYIAFCSIATNLIAGDTNVARDIFVHDSQSGTTTRV